MALQGIYVECNRQMAAGAACTEVIYTGQPAWVENVLWPGTSVNAVPGAAMAPYAPVPNYTLRITALEAAYVLVGYGTLTPSAGNGVLMQPGQVLVYSVQPGERVAWAASYASSLGNSATIRQVRAWLAANGSPLHIYTVSNAMSADLANLVTIQWDNGTVMNSGDDLYIFIQNACGLTSNQMAAALAAMKLLPA